jgi:hypothetical protein
MSVGGLGVDAVGGCAIFPADNIWNVPVDTLPVDANSAAYVASIGSTAHVHADFGSGLWDGGPIGIPYIIVPGSQPRVPVSFYWDDESDPGPYPIPPNAPIEGGSQSDGDRHVLVMDNGNCVLYELYRAFPQNGGASWQADSGAVFDLDSHALRPLTWTSADAAGLPILAGLVLYDEVASGEIRHAIRFTAPQTRRAFVWPARHYASDLTGPQYPAMGQRFRLKASYNISGFAPQVQVILRALKTYGMMLADNGSPWYISGAPDERWDNDILHQLHSVPGSAFEAVDVSSLMIDPNSGQARTSPVATPTRTATQSTAPTPTATRTPTVAPSPSATRTRTRTSTATPPATQTATVTRTATQASPATATPTRTATTAPVATGTATLTRTATPAPATRTTTATRTATETVAPSKTATPTRTHTPTRTPTATSTPTATRTRLAHTVFLPVILRFYRATSP